MAEPQQDNIDLRFLFEQNRLLMAEVAAMRDDMRVLTAIVTRIDGSTGRVLDELRAMHTQSQRLAERVRQLEQPEPRGQP
jgi:hypothetical protein